MSRLALLLASALALAVACDPGSAEPALAAPDETDTRSVTPDLGPVIDAGRIVRSEEGFAVTFPDDWTVREPTPEGVDSVLSGSDPGVPEGTDFVLLAYSAVGGQVCTILDVTRTQRANPDWTSPDDAVAGDRKAFESDPTTVDVDSGFVDLPSGQAAYTGHLVEDGLYSRSYYLVSGDSWYVLGCASRDRPADRWLAIAETFEFLPTTTGPVVIGGRIDLPDSGFGLEVPDGWIAADLRHPDLVPRLGSMATTGSWLAQALDGSLGASFDDRAKIGHEMLLWTSPAEEGPRNRQHCEVWVQESTLTSIGKLIELNSQRFADDSTQTWAQVDLPAGQAARHDFGWSPTSFGSEYILLDGHRLVTLGCVQGVPVEGVDETARRDAWLSIAETLEFLPVEE